jgi:periplasmic divalent cation tolerance protein
MTDVILVLTTAPEDEAERLARTLVDERLAACVNVHAPMTSIYRWKGAVERDTEQQLVIKTTSERLQALVERLTALHSYELPELLVVPTATGSVDYIAWVRSETTAVEAPPAPADQAAAKPQDPEDEFEDF